jgi:hypothetical protein
MGNEVLEAPGSTTDTNYQQLLNAFGQQTQDIQDLADGLRDGFDGSSAYNLKDLLVEMAMSGWFRAKSIEAGADNERERELDGVGTRRLLTPEELEKKNRAILGSTWQEAEDASWDWDEEYTGLSDRFRIYYGGIDSFGIKERARQLTALMSNVATRMALESACYVVLQDFDLADNQRRLFDGIDHLLTPATEGSSLFATPPDYDSRSTQAFNLALQAGEKQLRVSFLNPYWDSESGTGNQVFIDRVRITRNGNTVLDVQGEDFRDYPGFEQLQNFWEGEYHDTGDVHWENGQPVAWQFWTNNAWVSLPFTADSAGSYRVEISGWGFEVPAGDPAIAGVAVNALDPYSNHAGASILREKIAKLYERLLGEAVPSDHEEVEIIYELLVETWLERVASGDDAWATQWPDENCPMPGSFYSLPEEDQTRMWSDTALMKGSWMTVVSYLMTHYKYLHE